MGTHYRYVNYTRKEYLSLSDLRDGGDKVSALIYCSAALAWLLMPGWMRGDGYCGRWAPVLETRSRQDVDHKLTVANDIRVVPDYDDWHHLEEFVNISPGVLSRCGITSHSTTLSREVGPDLASAHPSPPRSPAGARAPTPSPCS